LNRNSRQLDKNISSIISDNTFFSINPGNNA